MAEPRSIESFPNLAIIHMDDGATYVAYPSGSNVWLVSGGGDGPGPDPDDFRYPFPRAQHTTYAGHSGADWPGGDRPVPAIGAGTVVQRFAFSGNTYPGDSSEPVWRGNCLVINHGVIEGIQIWSLYAHLRDTPALQVGDNVAAGEIIGHTGNTGFSDGSHLHFEVIYDGQRLGTGQGGYERTMGWMDAHTDGSSW